MNYSEAVQSSLFSLPTPALLEEYLLVMNPDEKVSNDVTFSKKKVAEIIGNYPGRYSLPHISIVNFSGNSQNETSIVASLGAALKGKIRASFIWLEDYGCMHSSGTVYIQPKPHSYFTAIIKAIYPALKLCSAIDKKRKLQFSYEPHITIARGMSKTNTDKVWDLFKDKKYENKFIADSLTLLRRDAEQEGKYKIVAEFRL